MLCTRGESVRLPYTRGESVRLPCTRGESVWPRPAMVHGVFGLVRIGTKSLVTSENLIS